MKRKIEETLHAWKATEDDMRMPLVIQGARQTGKTYAALGLGRESYLNTAYFNFEDTPALKGFFERTLRPAELLPLLSAFCGQSIHRGQTLIVFDEIQACPRALTSLKYFYEQEPAYHLVATGNLLGIALNREDVSFPAGKVAFCDLHPMDFEEFLWALGEKPLADAVREHSARVLAAPDVPESSFPLHAKGLALLREYLVCGGMPEVVDARVRDGRPEIVLTKQKTINAAYVGDMAKYATPDETMRITRVWDSMPRQLTKENRKFQYRAIRSGARASEYETALFWLEKAALLNRCNRVSLAETPLVAYEDPGFFKEYLLDSGILVSRLGIAPSELTTDTKALGAFEGMLAENYVMQALVAHGLAPCYWAYGNQAEVEFVLQRPDGTVVPVEVKAGTRTGSVSLGTYRKRFRPPYCLRVTAQDFGFAGGIKAVPLYALFCLEL
ncbi:MAG: ATP-binding protein [Coriobacteriales bacterium]|jgi:predicted AAA+ superfamily ATPase|nr:ATP-binding protein [Coriobacteriales bacterium]